MVARGILIIFTMTLLGSLSAMAKQRKPMAQAKGRTPMGIRADALRSSSGDSERIAFMEKYRKQDQVLTAAVGKHENQRSYQ
jgi:hypothetical protein